MLTRARDHARIHRRQCVACGYGGRFVDRPGQSHCPRCACDFSSRPPRSYAEMEGLDASDPAPHRRRPLPLEPEDRDWRMLTRWMLFLAGVGLVVISVAALGFAAFVVR